MAAFAIAALSMIGLPPTIGFVSKWFMLSGAMSASSTFGSSVAVTAIVVSTLLNAAYFLPIVYHAFFSDEQINDSEVKKHEAMRGHEEVHRHEEVHAHGDVQSHGDAPLSMRIALIFTAGLTLLLFFLADSLVSLASGVH
jgi:multicomponent Na+:H+ antiporter subunit D